MYLSQIKGDNSLSGSSSSIENKLVIEISEWTRSNPLEPNDKLLYVTLIPKIYLLLRLR